MSSIAEVPEALADTMMEVEAVAGDAGGVQAAAGGAGGTGAVAKYESAEVYWLRSISQWTEQVSLHLTHVEKRAMEADYEGHEVVRQFGQMLDGFVPPPRGDWGWMLRRIRDVAVRALRQLKKIYGDKSHEEPQTFQMRSMQVVRLLLEEAFHRCLLAAEGDKMRIKARDFLAIASHVLELAKHIL